MNLLDILGYAGNLVDLPGSSLRDILTGRNPFDQWSTPFTDENRATGRDVLSPFLGENEETGMSGWLDNPMEGVKDLAGFGVEMVADPLNFLTMSPLLKALKGRRAAAATNAGIDAVRTSPVRNMLADQMTEGFGESGTRTMDLIDSYAIHNKLPVDSVHGRIEVGPPSGSSEVLLQNPMSAGYKAEPFYSKIMEAIDDGAVPNKVGRDQLIKALRGYGVKQEELDDMTSQIDTLFASSKGGKVSKDEVFDLAADNAYEGVYTTKLYDSEFDTPQIPLPEEVNTARRLLDEMIDIDTRETMDAVESGITDRPMSEEYSRAVARYEASIPAAEEAERRWFAEVNAVEDAIKPAKYEGYRVSGGEPGSYRELLIRHPAAKGFADGNHFNGVADDVIAHARFDDIKLPGGGKALRIQEIQSDLHQQAAKRGYGNADPLHVEEAPGGGWMIADGRMEDATGEYFDTRQEAEGFLQQVMDAFPEKNGLPNSPFKKSWHELALKSVLRQAVEGGYDNVVVAPGKDIAKVVGGPSEALGSFYDNKIANTLRKMVRKYGGDVETSVVKPDLDWKMHGTSGGVGTMHVADFGDEAEVGIVRNWGHPGKEYRLEYSEMATGIDVWGEFPTVEAAKAAAAERLSKNQTVYKLTPALKREVLKKGQPLYQNPMMSISDRMAEAAKRREEFNAFTDTMHPDGGDMADINWDEFDRLKNAWAEVDPTAGDMMAELYSKPIAGADRSAWLEEVTARNTALHKILKPLDMSQPDNQMVFNNLASAFEGGNPFREDGPLMSTMKQFASDVGDIEASVVNPVYDAVRSPLFLDTMKQIAVEVGEKVDDRFEDLIPELLHEGPSTRQTAVFKALRERLPGVLDRLEPDAYRPAVEQILNVANIFEDPAAAARFEYDRQLAKFSKGDVLRQNPMSPKGQIDFSGEKMRISPLEPDASTAPHEAAHALRRMLGEDQMAEASNMFGGQWDVPAEEGFAQGLESWLQRTNTTAPGMADTMGYFNREIGNVYQNPMVVPEGADQLYEKILGITGNRSPLDRALMPGLAKPAMVPALHQALARFNTYGGSL